MNSPAGSVRTVFQVRRLDGQRSAQSAAATTPRAPNEVFKRQCRPEPVGQVRRIMLHGMAAAAMKPDPMLAAKLVAQSADSFEHAAMLLGWVAQAK